MHARTLLDPSFIGQLNRTPVVPANPIHLWHCEEATGDRVDSIGSAPFHHVVGTAVTQVAGKIGYAAHGDGTAFLRAIIDLSAPDWTFAFWFKQDATAVAGLFWIDGLAQVGILFDGNVRLVYGGGVSFTFSGGVDGGVAAPGIWHLVFARLNGNRLGIRVNNGALQEITVDRTYTDIALTNTPMRLMDIFTGIVYPSTELSLTGAMDEIVMWDYAITKAQMDYVWNGGAGRSL